MTQNYIGDTRVLGKGNMQNTKSICKELLTLENSFRSGRDV